MNDQIEGLTVLLQICDCFRQFLQHILPNIGKLQKYPNIGHCQRRQQYDSLFAPWISLATVDTMLRSVDETTWSGDNNFGEMFLNFWIHPEIRNYTGIDLTALLLMLRLRFFLDVFSNSLPVSASRTIIGLCHLP